MQIFLLPRNITFPMHLRTAMLLPLCPLVSASLRLPAWPLAPSAGRIVSATCGSNKAAGLPAALSPAAAGGIARVTCPVGNASVPLDPCHLTMSLWAEQFQVQPWHHRLVC